MEGKLPESRDTSQRCSWMSHSVQSLPHYKDSSTPMHKLSQDWETGTRNFGVHWNHPGALRKCIAALVALEQGRKRCICNKFWCWFSWIAVWTASLALPFPHTAGAEGGYLSLKHDGKGEAISPLQFFWKAFLLGSMNFILTQTKCLPGEELWKNKI